MAKNIETETQIGRRLRLRDLHLLSVVAQCGSMAKAATQLRLSQPVVSEVVANLERSLGVRLFDRTYRGVETTIYGQALLKCSRAAFGELKQGIRDIEYLADPTSGELRIASTGALLSSILAPIIGAFGKSFPHVILHVQELPPPARDLSGLRNREYDLAFGRLGVSLPLDALGEDLNVEVLLHDKLVVAAGPKSPLAARRKVDLAELIDGPWVLGEARSWRYTSLLEAFHARGLPLPKPSVVSASVHIISYLVTTGPYVTAISKALADRHALKVLPVALPPQQSPIVVTTLRNRTLSPWVERFIAYAREVTKSPAGNGKRTHP